MTAYTERMNSSTAVKTKSMTGLKYLMVILLSAAAALGALAYPVIAAHGTVGRLASGLKEGEEDRYASSYMKAFFLGNVVYIFHRLVIRAVLESAFLLESTSPALIAAVSLLIVVPLGLMFYICTARTLKKYQRRD